MDFQIGKVKITEIPYFCFGHWVLVFEIYLPS